jgi:hypothetical protein
MTAPTDRLLPEAFADLEHYARTWSLSSETERYAQRMASSIEEMQAFYDACFARVEAAMAFCDQFAFDELPADAARLLELVLSLVMVSFPVEAWRQARVPETGTASLERFIEPIP